MSLCLAFSLFEDLTVARNADVEEDLADRADWMSSCEDEGEDWTARRTWAALRATAWACLRSGSIQCFFLLGGFDSSMILKDISAARLRAKYVQFRRIILRLWDAGLRREFWRRGSADERRFSYSSCPSWFQRTLTLVLGTLGATMAGGGGL